MIDHPFFKEAFPVLQALEAAGYEAYFVGGAVRDLFLNRPIHDVDIATAATPDEVKTVFLHTVDVGIEHGTILVLLKGQSFEVTTFRTESVYSDFRRPDDVQFVRSLQEDLKRRDFTMNAMAMTSDGQFIDPFNGRQDVNNRMIRTVGDASERFSEDALRMMRAARFVSQLSFELDLDTRRAMKEYAPLLSHIAIERKLNEMDKLFAGLAKEKGLSVLIETGLFLFLPGLSSQKKALAQMASRTLKSLNADQMWLLIAFEVADRHVTDFLRNWRMSAKRIKRIEKGVRTLRRVRAEGWHDVLLYEAQIDASVDCAEVEAVLDGRESKSANVISRWQTLPIKDRDELDLTGADLMEWSGKQRGIWIKECLELAEKAVVNREIENKKEQIKEWLRSCNLL